MAETYTLEAQTRTVFGKQVRALRAKDVIPAIIYGAGFSPIAVSCPRRPLEILLKNAGSTHLIQLTVDGKAHNTLVREVQRDKIKRNIMHVDFLEVDLSKTLRTEVQITLVGVPKLPTELMISTVMSSIEVECLPANIPDHIELDGAVLNALGAKLTVADLPRLEGVIYMADAHEMIAMVSTLSAVEETGEGVEGIASEPEVVERGKKEEEDF